MTNSTQYKLDYARLYLYEALLELKDAILGAPREDNPEFGYHGKLLLPNGICWNLPKEFIADDWREAVLPIWDAEYTKALASWPLFSYNSNFPVPHPDLDECLAYTGTDNLYNLDTEYGRNRLSLVEHLIDYFKP